MIRVVVLNNFFSWKIIELVVALECLIPAVIFVVSLSREQSLGFNNFVNLCHAYFI